MHRDNMFKKITYIFMECFVYSVSVSQNDAFSHKETENNVCRRRHGHAVVRFFSDEGVVASKLDSICPHTPA